MNSENKKHTSILGNNEMILVADDDDTIRKVCKEILGKGGYRVLIAEDGEQAIKLFDENAQEIDVVIIDVVMPKMNGRGVYDYIQNNSPLTPIIFTSGYGSYVVHASFCGDHEIHFINKPYQKDTLLQKVQDVLKIERQKQ